MIQRDAFFSDLEVIAVSPIGFHSDTGGTGRGYSVPEEKQALWAACEDHSVTLNKKLFIGIYIHIE